MGSEAQRAKYLKGILSAEDIWCQGFSEPDNGSDLGNAQTRAVRDGEHYVVTGSKIWTTLGKYARYMILLARTRADTSRKYDGLTFFLAPMQIEGVETRAIKKLTGEHGFTQTFFTDARAPADGLVGPEGGLSPQEQQAAQAAGFIGIRLGPRVLRTETAPLAAMAALQSMWGDL